MSKQELIYSILDHLAQNPKEVEAIKKRESKAEVAAVASSTSDNSKSFEIEKEEKAAAAPAPKARSRFKREKAKLAKLSTVTLKPTCSSILAQFTTGGQVEFESSS